ncbi:MAG: hypothetical protein FWE23_08350 [Chitinivibrionia bacterium]|nr:hypothetical protein [Chitinivibrionia bacterium]
MIENETINALRESLKVLPANEEQRIRYEARLKMQRDIWSFEDAARRERTLEIVKLLKRGHSVDEIERAFLSREKAT